MRLYVVLTVLFAIMFGLGVFAGSLDSDTVIHLHGSNNEVRVTGPVKTVVFEDGSFGNMVISDRGKVTQ